MSNLTVVDALKKGKALIEDEKNWTRGVFENGRGQMCARGALHKASVGAELIFCEDYLNKAAIQMRPDLEEDQENNAPCAVLNNDSPHFVVMAMFDRAIQMAEADAV